MAARSANFTKYSQSGSFPIDYLGKSENKKKSARFEVMRIELILFLPINKVEMIVVSGEARKSIALTRNPITFQIFLLNFKVESS